MLVLNDGNENNSTGATRCIVAIAVCSVEVFIRVIGLISVYVFQVGLESGFVSILIFYIMVWVQGRVNFGHWVCFEPQYGV